MSDYQPTPPPSTAYVPAGYGVPAKQPILSILSMIGGILGVLLSFVFGSGIIFGIAGIVLGVIGRRKEPAARGFWITGIVTGAVAVLISLIVIAFFVVIFIAAASSANEYATYSN